MPKVTVIIPTRNRLESLKKSIESIRGQTYTDWELIVIDDGSELPVCPMATSLGDDRIKCIRHNIAQGGGAARNTGIRAAAGDFIAFLDDDDEWVLEKLDIQMERFTDTPADVGFCFSAVTNIYDDHEETSYVLDGVHNHFTRALGNPKGYLTVTLVIKREIFEKIGLFDEALPSHQEADLIIRVSKHFKGLGINQPLVRVNMHSSYDRIGGKIERRIAGREMIIRKHLDDFQRHPDELASHYFQLGLWYRALGKYHVARQYFWRAILTKFSLLSSAHMISLLGNGVIYRLVRLFRNERTR